MGWQTNRILETIGTATGGTQSINFNLEAIEALMVTLQADVADGIRPPNATTGGTGPTTFTSTSYGTIATASTGRLGCQIFSEGPGTLHVTLGTATTSTSSYTVRLASGDYFEVPANYTGLIGGIFATAGTARVTQVS
jgi:hypothetical protein